MSELHDMRDLPTVSVILPVLNEAKFIEQSLGAVLAQDYPAEKLNVLIADGGSVDGTPDIIRAMPGAERVQILPNPQRRQAPGLNRLIEAATGDIIVRVDGHTVIAPDYVRQCVTALHETGAYEVGGLISPAGLTPTGKAIAAATSSAFAVPGPFHTGTKGQFTDTAYLGAWPRWVFEQVGGYDERLRANEDYELNYRIRQSGGKIYFSPAIRSTYYGRQTMGALARQYYQYGRAKVAMLRQHPQSVRPRHLVAPVFVAALALGPLLAIWLKWMLWLWGGMLAAYAALALLFGARAAQRHATRTFWRIPCVFAVVHVAWGAGFWVGIFRHTRA